MKRFGFEHDKMTLLGILKEINTFIYGCMCMGVMHEAGYVYSIQNT